MGQHKVALSILSSQSFLHRKTALVGHAESDSHDTEDALQDGI